MDQLFEIWDKPPTGKYLIAGWHQWADAGDISSGLPHYLINHNQATITGRIRSEGYYLFQLPGAHHFLRPVVTLEEGHRELMQERHNHFHYAGDEMDGFLIFLGDEPHMDEDRYAKAFLDAVEAMGVERVAAVAGVYGPVPYAKDRDVSCVYSLPRMKEELSHSAVRFSNYEGGATICTYLAHKAEERDIEFFVLYAFVPSYDFSTQSLDVAPIAMDEDYKAWYDVMRRLNVMFELGLDLTDLRRRSTELVTAWDSKMSRLARSAPQLKVTDYMKQVDAEFAEETSDQEKESDIWEEALRDIFEDDDTL